MARRLASAALALLVVVHALVHVVAGARGRGWIDAEGPGPTSGTAGAAWLLVGMLLVAAAVFTVLRASGWWWVLGAAAVASQALVITEWSDAMAGTLVNALLLTTAVWGFYADGPPSLRRLYRQRADAAQGEARVAARKHEVVSERDLDGLPSPVAEYVRRSGAVGRPRVTGFVVTAAGRIRGGAAEAWMPFRSRQVNTFGDDPQRLFLIDATMKGVRVDVLHRYVHGRARMEVRLGGVLRIVRAAGPELTRSETVTLLNDLVVFAPAAIVGAPIRWREIDDRTVSATYTVGDQSVSAVITFDDDHQLVNFTSSDRSASSADGSTFTRMDWSTPITEHAEFDGRRCGVTGYARWHPADAPAFDYLEISADSVEYID